MFISNLQWWTTDAELEQLCAAHGRVLSIRFIDDKACGKSRGMAIVEYAEPGAADSCISGLNGCVALLTVAGFDGPGFRRRWWQPAEWCPNGCIIGTSFPAWPCMPPSRCHLPYAKPR